MNCARRHFEILKIHPLPCDIIPLSNELDLRARRHFEILKSPPPPPVTTFSLPMNSVDAILESPLPCDVIPLTHGLGTPLPASHLANLAQERGTPHPASPPRPNWSRALIA